MWLRLARYVEKPVACQIASTGTACILFCAWLLMGEGGVFGTGNALPLFVGNFVAGLFAAGLWIIPASMLADVADADRLEHGQAREGLFFGMLNFGEKMAAGLSLLLGGVLLQFFVDLRPDAVIYRPKLFHELVWCMGRFRRRCSFCRPCRCSGTALHVRLSRKFRKS